MMSASIPLIEERAVFYREIFSGVLCVCVGVGVDGCKWVGGWVWVWRWVEVGGWVGTSGWIDVCVCFGGV